MTHIDTYSHRIPHKYTQYCRFYTHIHTNCHIFGWVIQKHTYIYIYIYIQKNQHIHTYSHRIPHKLTQLHTYSQKKKNSSIKKTKQTNENQNQIIIHS